MVSDEPSSPRIFAPSSLAIDDSKLCFNKNHFSRPDFDVQRFMNLARRRAGLEQILGDLRLYLKSLQHSMIELINDDYADFVHLSSNLVALQSSIDKIDKDIQTFWTEFESSTTDSVGTAEQIELRCDQLSYNRRRQTELRDKIAFLAALHRLQQLVSKASSSVLWLEKVASCVVDLTSYSNAEKLEENSRERQIHARSLAELERFLCKEGVQSASGDCSTLPIVLSILSLTNSSHVLTAAIVADYLHPSLVHTKENLHELLKDILKGVTEIREKWIKVLGMRFSNNLKVFLDQTLLTFVLTFLEKCLGMVIVPTDTKLFHKCFTTIDEFVRNWPSSSHSRALLKAVRDKFNFLVYFKLTTFKLSKQVDSLGQYEAVELCKSDQKLKCTFSAAVLTAIETVWSDDVFLFPLIDKFWDFTLKLLAKHLSWAQNMIEVLQADDSETEGVSKWKNILYIRSDLKSLHSAVFDLGLEQIWTKLRDLGVETSMFGQSLTRHGQRVDIECSKYDELFLKIASTTVEEELEAAADIPKSYRWTRKPAPTTPSPYVEAAIDKLKNLGNELESLEMDSEEVCSKITKQSFSYLISKLTEVFQATQMHTTSRILVSRKTNVAASEGLSDNDKIKIQIFHDLDACINFIQEKGIEVEGLSELMEKCRMDEQILTASPIPPSNSSNSLVGNDEAVEVFTVTPQSSLIREGSA